MYVLEEPGLQDPQLGDLEGFHALQTLVLYVHKVVSEETVLIYVHAIWFHKLEVRAILHPRML